MVVKIAITKIWKVKSRLDKVLDYTENEEKTLNKNYSTEPSSLSSLLHYAVNPEKTEKQIYVTGINCSDKNALQEMEKTKAYYNKRNNILAFHAVQSFKENEVTPQIAHEIGTKLAEEMWGDRFEVVVTTHLNTNCLHNHFVINSVSFKDGKKLYQDLSKLALLRSKSDELCLEYGLSTIKEVTMPSGINFENFLKKYKTQNPYYKEVQEDIDRAIRQARDYIDFLSIMKDTDYEVTTRANKLSIRRTDHKRNIRIERAFGDNYKIERIKERINEEKEIRVPFQDVYSRVYKPKKKYIYKKRNGKLQKKYITYSIDYTMMKQKQRLEDKEELKKLRQFSENTKFLVSRNINTIEELTIYKQKQLETMDNIDTQIINVKRLLKNPKLTNENQRLLNEKLEMLKIQKKYAKEENTKCNKVLELEKQKYKEIDRKEIQKDEYRIRYSDERS